VSSPKLLLYRELAKWSISECKNGSLSVAGGLQENHRDYGKKAVTSAELFRVEPSIFIEQQTVLWLVNNIYSKMSLGVRKDG